MYRWFLIALAAPFVVNGCLDGESARQTSRISEPGQLPGDTTPDPSCRTPRLGGQNTAGWLCPHQVVTVSERGLFTVRRVAGEGRFSVRVLEADGPAIPRASQAGVVAFDLGHERETVEIRSRSLVGLYLTYESTVADELCTPDVFETFEEAPSLVVPAIVEGTICADDLDAYIVPVQRGVPIRASLRFDNAVGDLDLLLLDGLGLILAESAGADDNEGLWYLPAEDGLLRVVVDGFRDASAPYTLVIGQDRAPPAVGPDAPMVSVTTTFDDPSLNLDTAQYEGTRRPLSSAFVEVLDADTGRLLGAGATDRDGRASFPFVPGNARAVSVRVMAAADVDFPLAVVDSSRAVYAAGSQEWPVAELPDELALHLALDDGTSDPFNALDALVRSGSRWREETGLADLPPLDVVWEPGRSVGCGTCYRHEDEPSTLYALGLDDDNDALDDAVLTHELGHYFQHHLSADDSPGGSHDGTPTDPRLAFAEGWATAWATISAGDPAYLDGRDGGYTLIDVDVFEDQGTLSPGDDYSEFAGDELRDVISEYLVAGLIWDFWDGGNDDDDHVSLGSLALVPIYEHLASGQRAVRGVPGVDFVDYLDGLACTGHLDVAVEERLSEASFPWDGQPACKPDVPPWLRRDVAHPSSVRLCDSPRGVACRDFLPSQRGWIRAEAAGFVWTAPWPSDTRPVRRRRAWRTAPPRADGTMVRETVINSPGR